MSSTLINSPIPGKAETAFRAAFDRLRAGKPQVLPKGTPVSQNNVAREAGRDPSALKKDRYPALIREIQAWVENNEPITPHHLAKRLLPLATITRH